MIKRIAIISDHASPLATLGGVDSGGQNIYVSQIASHLAAMGYGVDVYTRRDSESLPERAMCKNGVRIMYVPAGPARYIRKEDMLPLMDEFTDNMERYLKTEGEYQIIHANFFMSGLVAQRLKCLRGIPFIITFHALGRVRRLHQKEADLFPKLRFEIEDRIVAEADGIVAECPQDKDDLINLYHADASRIKIIPCGFEPDEFWPVSKSLARRITGFKTSERVILHLGRLVPRKGIDTVIRGFARVVKDYRMDGKLAVVGGATRKPDTVATPEIGRLARIAQEEGIRDKVIFKGYASRDELKFFYSAADLFVTTPWYEPFGITPLEAMACGTPVIGSRVGGIKFSVKDGETGFLVPPKDPEALANRIAYLFRYPKLMEYCRGKAIRRSFDLFTWKTVAFSLSEFCENVIAAHREMDEEVTSTIASMV